MLGAGFLEKVYESALLRPPAAWGQRQGSGSFPVCYKGRHVGEYIAQSINYLKASGLAVALLLNFQKPKVDWKRILLDA